MFEASMHSLGIIANFDSRVSRCSSARGVTRSQADNEKQTRRKIFPTPLKTFPFFGARLETISAGDVDDRARARTHSVATNIGMRKSFPRGVARLSWKMTEETDDRRSGGSSLTFPAR